MVIYNNNIYYRAYPVYVNEYASGTQQQYYTTNESFSATGNQGETYIVPVEETMIANQSRESPQAISAVSINYIILIMLQHRNMR